MLSLLLELHLCYPSWCFIQQTNSTAHTMEDIQRSTAFEATFRDVKVFCGTSSLFAGGLVLFYLINFPERYIVLVGWMRGRLGFLGVIPNIKFISLSLLMFSVLMYGGNLFLDHKRFVSLSLSSLSGAIICFMVVIVVFRKLVYRRNDDDNLIAVVTGGSIFNVASCLFTYLHQDNSSLVISLVVSGSVAAMMICAFCKFCYVEEQPSLEDLVSTLRAQSESRNDEIKLRDGDIADKNVLLAQMNVEIQQKDAEIEQMNVQLMKRDAQIEDQDAQIHNRDELIATLETEVTNLKANSSSRSVLGRSFMG